MIQDESHIDDLVMLTRGLLGPELRETAEI